MNLSLYHSWLIMYVCAYTCTQYFVSYLSAILIYQKVQVIYLEFKSVTLDFMSGYHTANYK